MIHEPDLVTAALCIIEARCDCGEPFDRLDDGELAAVAVMANACGAIDQGKEPA